MHPHTSFIKHVATTEMKCGHCKQVRLRMLDFATFPCLPPDSPDAPEPSGGGWSNTIPPLLL